MSMFYCVQAQFEMMSGVRDALMMTGLSFHVHALPGKRTERKRRSLEAKRVSERDDESRCALVMSASEPRFVISRARYRKK